MAGRVIAPRETRPVREMSLAPPGENGVRHVPLSGLSWSRRVRCVPNPAGLACGDSLG